MILTWSGVGRGPGERRARRLLATFERIGSSTVETCRLLPLSGQLDGGAPADDGRGGRRGLRRRA
ncbi:MAG: hypothetical protein R3F43_22495 [bacterium]